jgi:hypothetical protein
MPSGLPEENNANAEVDVCKQLIRSTSAEGCWNNKQMNDPRRKKKIIKIVSFHQVFDIAI